MHIICLSMPVLASTELTEFLYISCRKKITTFLFQRPLSAGTRGQYAPPHYPPPLLRSYSKHTFKYRYNLQDEIQICRLHSVLCCNEVTVTCYVYFSNLAVK